MITFVFCRSRTVLRGGVWNGMTIIIGGKSVHDSLTFVDRVTVANRFYALLVRFSRRDVGYERLR